MQVYSVVELDSLQPVKIQCRLFHSFIGYVSNEISNLADQFNIWIVSRSVQIIFVMT